MAIAKSTPNHQFGRVLKFILGTVTGLFNCTTEDSGGPYKIVYDAAEDEYLVTESSPPDASLGEYENATQTNPPPYNAYWQGAYVEGQPTKYVGYNGPITGHFHSRELPNNAKQSVVLNGKAYDVGVTVNGAGICTVSEETAPSSGEFVDVDYLIVATHSAGDDDIALQFSKKKVSEVKAASFSGLTSGDVFYEHYAPNVTTSQSAINFYWRAAENMHPVSISGDGLKAVYYDGNGQGSNFHTYHEYTFDADLGGGSVVTTTSSQPGKTTTGTNTTSGGGSSKTKSNVETEDVTVNDVVIAAAYVNDTIKFMKYSITMESSYSSVTTVTDATANGSGSFTYDLEYPTETDSFSGSYSFNTMDTPTNPPTGTTTINSDHFALAGNNLGRVPINTYIVFIDFYADVYLRNYRFSEGGTASPGVVGGSMTFYLEPKYSFSRKDGTPVTNQGVQRFAGGTSLSEGTNVTGQDGYLTDNLLPAFSIKWVSPSGINGTTPYSFTQSYASGPRFATMEEFYGANEEANRKYLMNHRNPVDGAVLSRWKPQFLAGNYRTPRGRFVQRNTFPVGAVGMSQYFVSDGLWNDVLTPPLLSTVDEETDIIDNSNISLVVP